jgi:acyl-CoA thioesterase
MGLDQDTAVDGGNARYRAKLSEAWRIWSPNGGYLATIALRAAGRESAFRHPVSLTCHFLSVGAFDSVDLEVVCLRRSRVAESLRVTMTQSGKKLLEAMVWTSDGVDGYVHDDLEMPDVPPPHALAPLDTLRREPAPHPFWANLEMRPLAWVPYAERTPGAPRELQWVRFRPQALFEDPFVDAGRCLVVLDTMGWPAASLAHVGDPRFIAPTLSLNVDFHDRNTGSEWLLSDAWAPVARGGLMAVNNRVWSEDRRLLASSAMSLICRPRLGA